MPRRLRIATGGLVYHVLNRAVGRQTIFKRESDYEAFVRVIERTHDLLPTRIAALCLMPNHWHLVVWPRQDGELSEFMRVLTVTHTQRWHANHHSAGTGPLYQGRFKSCPVQDDGHFLTVCRYVERNPVRAGLVRSARNWKWTSAAMRALAEPPRWLLPLDGWPVAPRRDWAHWVDRPQTAAEEEALAECIRRGRPFGEESWQRRTAKKLGLESTLRPRGRPRVRQNKDSRPDGSNANSWLTSLQKLSC
jgi:putative transposase